jgi:hypothetical protein
VPDGYEVHVLVNPDTVEYDPIPIEKIHFAAPFMGALYVVAEFADSTIYHFWLQDAEVWEYATVYSHGDLVRPSVSTGLVYQASRLGDPYPAWAPNVPRFDADDGYTQSIIEPTVYNDYYYTCVLTGGTNPRSGDIEPEWPTEDGAQVIEYADGGDATETPAPPAPPSTDTPSPPYQDRYDRGDIR